MTQRALPAEANFVPVRDAATTGPGLGKLFATIPFASACPQLGYGIVGYFAALQIQSFDSVHKVDKLALVHAAVAIASMVAQPVVGLLSDRTHTRWGARAPWMLAGVLIAMIGMLGAGLSGSVATLLVAAVVVYIGCKTFGGPVTAIQPDRVPVERRGRYSTLAGLGTITAALLTPVIGATFANHIPFGYLLVAGIVVVVMAGFLLLNPDRDNRGARTPRLSARDFLRSWWINPVRYPDFAWMFLGRFLICSGYYMILTFQLYILEDYIGLDVHHATRLTPILSLAGLPGFLLAIGISGPLSDLIGRRKPLVFAGGLIIAAAAVIPIALPTVFGMICSGIVLTIGFGTFLAVDQALVTQVLPNPDNAAKDLGILSIAATLPNSIAPITGAMLVNAFGGYGALYPVVAVVAIASALAILPVKAR